MQVQTLKRNIGQFSGFVWSEQEVTKKNIHHLVNRCLVPGTRSAFVLRELCVCFTMFFQEEKQRAKTKEKIDKCVKDKLIDFCDVLDIPINKSNVKKVSDQKLLVDLYIYFMS